MSNYFSHFPKVDYDINLTRIGDTDNVVDIMRRFITHPKLNSRLSLFYDYEIQDGERPDVIADKYYGDSKYDWIILITNQIIDPNYNWPLSYENFTNFIVDKYVSIPTAKTTVHHYEQIIRAGSYNSRGTWLPEIVAKVDLTSYTALVATNRKIVYSYDYEKELNEDKRKIKIMDKKYLGTVLAGAEDIFGGI